MFLKDADRVRSNQEVVAVELCARGIVVHVETGLSRVSGEDEILHVVVGNQNVLMTIVVRIQSRVRVLFDHVVVEKVELVPVRVLRTEQPHGAVCVEEDEPAEVRVEQLVAGTSRNEIVVGTQVSEFDFAEVLLQKDRVISETPSAFSNVGVDDCQFLDIQLVEVECRRETNLPVDWLEGRRVSVVQVHPQEEVLIDGELVGISEELFLRSTARTFERRRADRSLTVVEQRLTGRCDV